MPIKPRHAFLPKRLQRQVADEPTLAERRDKRRRARWKRRHEQAKPPFPKIKHKTTYRIRAEDQRGLLTFFKLRTKKAHSEILRILSRSKVTPQRITI